MFFTISLVKRIAGLSLVELRVEKKWMTPLPDFTARACAVNAISWASTNDWDWRNVKPVWRMEVISEKSGWSGGCSEACITTGYWASLYKCGTDWRRMDELEVTETNFPARIGAKTDSNGSALCLIVKIYAYVNIGGGP